MALVWLGVFLPRQASGLELGAPLAATARAVTFAGAQGALAGLDQINVRLPRSLSGRGDVEVFLTVDGNQTNPARLTLK